MKTGIVFLLVMGGALAAASVDPRSRVLKPGALAAPVGSLIVVEDVLNIQISLNDLFQAYPILIILKGQMKRFHNHISNLKESMQLDSVVKQIIDYQVQHMVSLELQIESLTHNLPTLSEDVTRTAHAHRVKRGLFNFAGIISKSLFGTATEADVDKIGDQLRLVTQAVTLQNRVVKQTYQGLVKVNEQVQNLHDFVKNMTIQVNKLTNSYFTFERLMLVGTSLQLFTHYIEKVKVSTEQIVTDLVDSGLGRVTSKLLSLADLRQALQMAKEKFHLVPIFPEKLAAYYYPLLESTLTTDDILIHIPMKSSKEFTAWNIIPFPLMVDNTLVSVDIDDALLVVSDDLTLIDISKPSVLENCKSAYLHLHVCPAWIFSFIDANDALCELSLIKAEASKALRHCHYRPLVLKPVFHVHLKGYQYFYYPNDVAVALICQDKMKTVHHTIAKGFYVAPDYCEVRSKVIHTLPTHQHFAFKVNLSTELLNLVPPPLIDFKDISMKTDQIDLLTLMNNTKLEPIIEAALPLLLSRPVYFPYMIINVCIIVMIIIVFIYSYCKLYHNQLILLKLIKKENRLAFNFMTEKNTQDLPENFSGVEESSLEENEIVNG